jgi:hypothetical protein
MLSRLTRFLLVAISCLTVTFAQAQIIQSLGALERGKSVLEFYEAAVVNPQQVLLLSLEIHNLYLSTPSRYKDLSNDVAEKMGLFNKGPLGLEYIELRPEPSPGSQYGYFSITLKKLKFKQCEVLANYTPLSHIFVRVELNGSPIFSNASPQQAVAVCKSESFFQDGKNELKYVAY